MPNCETLSAGRAQKDRVFLLTSDFCRPIASWLLQNKAFFVAKKLKMRGKEEKNSIFLVFLLTY